VEVEDDDESQFVLDDYESDGEARGKTTFDSDEFSPAVRELMTK
jgi:hypothetical protein